jgi:TPR repeat protein
MQSVIPATGDVSATPSLSSTTQKLQSAPVVTPEQTELDSGSPEVRLLLAAVGKGDANAPVSLANMYLEGKGVSRSCDQALSLLQSAAAKPNARARNRLAAMYEIGTCVQRDRVQAYRWLTAALAVDSNNPWAQQNRDQTWREMTSEERTIAEAYR